MKQCCPYPGDEGEDLKQCGPEELRLLAGILHGDHVEELERLDGGVTEHRNNSLLLR